MLSMRVSHPVRFAFDNDLVPQLRLSLRNMPDMGESKTCGNVPTLIIVALEVPELREGC